MNGFHCAYSAPFTSASAFLCAFVIQLSILISTTIRIDTTNGMKLFGSTIMLYSILFHLFCVSVCLWCYMSTHTHTRISSTFTIEKWPQRFFTSNRVSTSRRIYFFAFERKNSRYASFTRETKLLVNSTPIQIFKFNFWLLWNRKRDGKKFKLNSTTVDRCHFICSGNRR